MRSEQSDEEFLRDLGQKLRGGSKSSEPRMTQDEADRMLDLMNQPDGRFAIAPANFIFNVGFYVFAVDRDSHVSGRLDYETLFNFREKQLPKGYGWDRMCDVFMNHRNLDILRLIRRAPDLPVRDRLHYEY